MKKNKKNLSIFKRIGLIAIALFTALGSFFVPVLSSKTNLTSYAADDSSSIAYQFDASDILFFETLIYKYDSNTEYSLGRFISFDFSFITSLEGYSIDFASSLFYYDGTSVGNIIPYYPFDPLLNDSTRWFTRSNFDDGYSINLVRLDTDEEYMPLFIKTDPGFVANCKCVNISVAPLGTYLGNNYHPTNTNFSSSVINIKYIDFNNNSLLIQILSPDTFASFYDNRTYYFNDNFTDNDIYNQGVLDGIAQNQQNIYDSGFNAGVDVGFNQGVQQGILQANDYSFVSLFGAVIDTPIKAFSGLFNFEILGINLLDFFLGLLTFGVIIFVIKLILGGK